MLRKMPDPNKEQATWRSNHHTEKARKVAAKYRKEHKADQYEVVKVDSKTVKLIKVQ